MTLDLRPYQRKALNSLYDYWNSGGGNGLIVLPTGAGKSLVIAKLCQEVLATYPGMRIGIVTHVKELVSQNAQELARAWPGAPIGIYSAGLGRRDTRAKILFMGIQSVYKKGRALGDFDMLVIDECFTAGTMIATPDGCVPIETIKSGDIVLNAFGPSIVEAVSERISDAIIELELTDGTVITCTENHPFFTDEGFVEAGKLEIGRRVFSRENLRELLDAVSSLDKDGRERQCNFLYEGKHLEEAKVLLDLLLQESGERNEYTRSPSKIERDFAKDWSSSIYSRREWSWLDQAAGGNADNLRERMDSGTRGSDNEGARQHIPDTLQDRHSKSDNDDSYRTGRAFPQWEEAGRGQEEGRSSDVIRVARVSRSERGCGTPVFNLQVAGHPSYFAGGVLVHNCHLIPRSSATMYGKFLSSCKNRVPDMRIVGLTATPYRLDSGRLDSGPEALFDKIVFEVNVRELIEAGYLSPLISKATLVQIDTSGLHSRAGEFIQSELDERARIPSIVESAVEEIVAAGQDRAGWLAFCTSVKHAGQVRDVIRRHNISCEAVTSDTPAGERDSIIRRYKEGKIRCLTSVGVLTTGFNAPHVDLLAMLRPTLSTGLYVQMVGRAFRLAPGKTNALILDFAGNVARHGPVDAIKPRRTGAGAQSDEDRGEGQERVLTKICPVCRAYAPMSKMECECGYCWPASPPRHEARAADDAPILTTEAVKPKGIEIEKVTFNRHTKPGSPDSMRVVYHSFAESFSQWVCFEHKGYARQKAGQWWSKMGGSAPTPQTVEEAMDRAPFEIKSVVGVNVRKTGKYPEIVSVTFANDDGRPARPRNYDGWAAEPPF